MVPCNRVNGKVDKQLQIKRLLKLQVHRFLSAHFTGNDRSEELQKMKKGVFNVFFDSFWQGCWLKAQQKWHQKILSID